MTRLGLTKANGIIIGLTLTVWGMLYFWPKIVLGALTAFVTLIMAFRFPDFSYGLVVNGQVVGIPISGIGLDNIVVLAFTGLSTLGIIYYAAQTRTSLIDAYGPLGWLVIAIGILMFFGSFYTIHMGAGLYKTLKYFLFNVYIFFSLLVFRYDLNKLNGVVLSVTLYGIALGFIALYVVAIEGVSTGERLDLNGRINPIWLARYISMGVIGLMFLMFRTTSKSLQLVYMLLLLAMTFAVFETGSRAPFLTLILSLFAYIVFQFKDNIKRILIYLPILIASSILPFMLVSAYVRNRFFIAADLSKSNLSIILRLLAWKDSWTIFMENLFFGAGTESFKFHGIGLNVHPHNIFLEAASELGLVGLIIVSSFIFLIFRLVWNLFKLNLSPDLRNLFNFMAVIFFFSFLNALPSGDMPGNPWIWFSAAGLLCVKFLHRYELHEKRQNSP